MMAIREICSISSVAAATRAMNFKFIDMPVQQENYANVWHQVLCTHRKGGFMAQPHWDYTALRVAIYHHLCGLFGLLKAFEVDRPKTSPCPKLQKFHDISHFVVSSLSFQVFQDIICSFQISLDIFCTSFRKNKSCLETMWNAMKFLTCLEFRPWLSFRPFHFKGFKKSKKAIEVVINSDPQCSVIP